MEKKNKNVIIAVVVILIIALVGIVVYYYSSDRNNIRNAPLSEAIAAPNSHVECECVCVSEKGERSVRRFIPQGESCKSYTGARCFFGLVSGRLQDCEVLVLPDER